MADTRTPELVCPRCNGDKRIHECIKRGPKFPSYSSELCPQCKGIGKTNTDADRPKQPEEDPLDRYLADGGLWD